jgi:hypothetical protein
VKRIYELYWTGRSSVSRIPSRVFTYFISVGQTFLPALAGKYACPMWHARRNIKHKQHPRRIGPAWSGREGVFLFLGGA